MKMNCEKCEGYYNKGCCFCGICGYKFPHRKGDMGKLEKAMLAGAILLAVMLLTEIITLISRTVPVLLGGGFNYVFEVILPEPMVVAIVHGDVALICWILTIIAEISCATYILWIFFSGVRKASAEKDSEHIERSSLYWVSVLFCANLFFEIVIFGLAEALGSGVDTSWMDEYTDDQMLVLLAYAPVWEELITRVMLIGLPIFLIQLVRTRNIGSAKLILGGFGMNKIAFILMIVSGIVFGMAHYYAWGMTKAAVTCIGGFVLGYVYIRFGLYAAIVMHFLTDYMSYAFMGVEVLYSLSVIAILFIGFLACVYLVTKMPSIKDARGKFDKMPLFFEKELKE